MISKLKKQELKELRSRKKTADENWEKILNALSKNEILEKSLIAYAMGNCNMADHTLLIKGLKL